MSNVNDRSLAAFWNEFRSAIKNKYSLIDEVMRLWFDDSSLTLLTVDRAVIITTTDFKKLILSTRYREMISETFAELLGQPLKSIEIRSREEEKERQAAKNVARSGLVKVDITGDDKPDIYVNLDDGNRHGGSSIPNVFEYTFENFVVGKSNELAAAAANAVSDNPGKVYNPLFIYGPSGLGKTHLLYAIAGKMSSNFPDARLVYVKGDDFTN